MPKFVDIETNFKVDIESYKILYTNFPLQVGVVANVIIGYLDFIDSLFTQILFKSTVRKNLTTGKEMNWLVKVNKWNKKKISIT